MVNYKVGHYKHIMTEYLNSAKVMEFGCETNFYPSVAVIVYRVSEFLPARDVTPNPRNSAVVSVVEKSYMAGYFCEKHFRWLTPQQFSDPSFWNT